MADDRKRRGAMSMQRLTSWGLVQAWLAFGNDRSITIRCVGNDLRVVVMSSVGSHNELVSVDEDPSAAALRAIEAITNGTANNG